MAAGERLSCMRARTLKLYIDYKSPYAYLAKDPAYRLERDTGIEIDWLPYILDIPAYLGSAKVDAEGLVLEQNRNAHQWRRVKYSYMDVRREANRVGLIMERRLARAFRGHRRTKRPAPNRAPPVCTRP